MCWAFFGCCGLTATIMSFNATTGARQWKKLRTTSSASNSDDIVVPWDSGQLLIFGQEQPTATATNEGVLMVRSTSGSDIGIYSASTPLTAINDNASPSDSRIIADPSYGVWLWRSGAGLHFFDTDLVHQWTFATATGTGIVRVGNDILLTKGGVTGSGILIDKIDSTGASSATFVRTSLSSSPGTTCHALPLGETGDVLVWSGRRLWRIDSSLTETLTNVGAGSAFLAESATYSNNVHFSPDGSLCALRIGPGTPSTSLIGIDTTTLSEIWTQTFSGFQQCSNANHIFCRIQSTSNLSARDWSDGSESWNYNADLLERWKVAEETGHLIGFDANINRGIDIVDESTGSLIYDIQGVVNAAGARSINDVLNHDGRYIATFIQRSFP